MSKPPEQVNPVLARASLWPASAQAPADDPTVLLLFHGLLAFAYNDEEGVCEVGVHGKAPDHEFHVVVIDYDPAHPSEDSVTIYPRNSDGTGEAPNGPIFIDVARPVTPGVSFFQPPLENGSLAGKDWRRVPDFEGPFFYNRPLGKKLKALRSRLYVKQGLFYTLSPTIYDFKRVDEDDENDTLDLGAIAFAVAADLSYEPGGYVTLKIGADDLRLQVAEGRKLIIHVTNSCMDDDGNPCEFNPCDPRKENRNDFYLYYKMFDLPAGRKEFLLKIDDSWCNDPRPTARAAVQNSALLDFLEKFSPLSNQEAPCGSAGFGQSSGFGGTGGGG